MTRKEAIAAARQKRIEIARGLGFVRSLSSDYTYGMLVWKQLLEDLGAEYVRISRSNQSPNTSRSKFYYLVKDETFRAVMTLNACASSS